MSRARDAAESTLVTLRVDLGTETMSGALADEQGDQRPFWALLEISGAIGELRGAGARRVDPRRIPEPESEK